MTSKSTKSTRPKKSKKPYPSFPLTAHQNGLWCKKHQGRQYYFSRLDDWEAALERFEREWRYIIKGRPLPPDDAGDGCKLD